MLLTLGKKLTTITVPNNTCNYYVCLYHSRACYNLFADLTKMAAKWLIVLVALMATASAQTTMMPEMTPAPMPTTEAPTTEGPTMGGMNTTVAQPNATIQDRFAASQANQTRGDHFYVS